MTAASHPVVVSHHDPAAFTRGLRSFLASRDLGISDITAGRVGAHVIRTVPGEGAKAEWHTHALSFQFVFMPRGWVGFACDGAGEVLLTAGSSVYQPPGIRHVEIAHSDDLELLEITMPARLETATAEAP